MSEEDKAARRKKRVKRIKCYLVVLFLILTLTPSVLAVVVLSRTSALQKQVDELEEKLARFELTSMLKEEAESGLENGAAAQEEEASQPKEMHFEYYEDDYVVPEDFRKVYLTFDDGPSIYTKQILDVLDTYGVKATFFVTGRQAQSHPEWYQEIVGRGHTIGMHSYSHIYNDIYESRESFEDDLTQIHDCIEYTTGIDCRLYRFPGGSSNSVSSVAVNELCKIVKDRGWQYYDWNISSQDASSTSLLSSEIVNNVVSGIGRYDNCMVLMHDSADKYSTVQALPSIIEAVLGMEKTVIVPIDDTTEPIQHLSVE